MDCITDRSMLSFNEALNSVLNYELVNRTGIGTVENV